MIEHPTYAHPQLAEAICELRFALPESTVWHAGVLGEFYKAAQNKFPILEPISEQSLELTVGSDGAHTQRSGAPKTKFKLTAEDKPFIIIFGEGSVSVSATPPYSGWGNFEAEISKAWELVNQILRVSHVQQIGMRYINRITRLSEDEAPGTWLEQGDFVPSALRKSKSGFLSRTEVQIDAANRHMVTIAHDRSSSPGSLIFDIDCIYQEHIDPAWEGIGSKINNIHEEIWSIFQQSASVKLKRLLEEGVAE
ncbi:TIGR04255 family protein [Methylobacterium sp. Leaf361]|uniref:TIGR04255 family protein n=1 Tax=Methylobacterium sp. Leaf361 TaxID=1736352 RepID=UPI0012FE8EF4|nr:TIGR04255 family protein [Methylobacterium sp. Leaf361]